MTSGDNFVGEAHKYKVIHWNWSKANRTNFFSALYWGNHDFIFVLDSTNQYVLVYYLEYPIIHHLFASLSVQFVHYMPIHLSSLLQLVDAWFFNLLHHEQVVYGVTCFFLCRCVLYNLNFTIFSSKVSVKFDHQMMDSRKLISCI